ncbi:putative (3S,6E)-nerolidol synthase [Helianthus annuus]|uniref:(3S,6E)-nerolidol synthase n=1 Tax=Helianthus annuus TaxID=4232 RepID=A0A251S462_HELAN|nr:putative (3S,6E)-nerolidol synthase [Helianthus annuus]KAJ0443436.1 putative (3S,6E)-nerolidol synthase [Helianthus annuus]
MVDALQKLCINHYFQGEIDSILKMFHTRMSNSLYYNHGPSLYEVSLNFRILRQEGYYVPAGEHKHSSYSTFESKLELFYIYRWIRKCKCFYDIYKIIFVSLQPAT